MKFVCPDCGQKLAMWSLDKNGVLWQACHWATVFTFSTLDRDWKKKRLVEEARQSVELGMTKRGHKPEEAYWGKVTSEWIPGEGIHDRVGTVRAMFLYKVRGDTLKKQKSKEPWLRMPEAAFEADEWTWGREKDYVPPDPERPASG